MDHVSDKKRSKTRVMSIYKSPDAYIAELEAKKAEMSKLMSDMVIRALDVESANEKALAEKEEAFQLVSAELAKERAEHKSDRNILKGAFETIERMTTETVFAAQPNEEINIKIQSEYVDRERLARQQIHYFTLPEAGRFSLGGLRAGDKVLISARVKQVSETVTDRNEVKNCVIDSHVWVSVISIGRCKPEGGPSEMPMGLRHPFDSGGRAKRELLDKILDKHSN